jgi:hypothetical protein
MLATCCRGASLAGARAAPAPPPPAGLPVRKRTDLAADHRPGASPARVGAQPGGHRYTPRGPPPAGPKACTDRRNPGAPDDPAPHPSPAGNRRPGRPKNVQTPRPITAPTRTLHTQAPNRAGTGTHLAAPRRRGPKPVQTGATPAPGAAENLQTSRPPPSEARKPVHTGAPGRPGRRTHRPPALDALGGRKTYRPRGRSPPRREPCTRRRPTGRASVHTSRPPPAGARTVYGHAQPCASGSRDRSAPRT